MNLSLILLLMYVLLVIQKQCCFPLFSYLLSAPDDSTPKPPSNSYSLASFQRYAPPLLLLHLIYAASSSSPFACICSLQPSELQHAMLCRTFSSSSGVRVQETVVPLWATAKPWQPQHCSTGSEAGYTSTHIQAVSARRCSHKILTVRIRVEGAWPPLCHV